MTIGTGARAEYTFNDYFKDYIDKKYRDKGIDVIMYESALPPVMHIYDTSTKKCLESIGLKCEKRMREAYEHHKKALSEAAK